MTMPRETPSYSVSGLSHYDGNPLIEALPPILSDEELVSRIANYPPLPTNDELALPYKVREHCVSRITSVVLPLEIHLRFESRFSQILREGYVARHPFQRDTVAMRHADSPERLKSSGFKSSANSLTLIGLSGMGKTTMLNSVVGLYPQVIQHQSYKGATFLDTQVVWLKIECPHDGSPKGLCAAFFNSLDNVLGTDYFNLYMRRQSSTSLLMQRMSQLCRTYYIGVLIIDEFQHLSLVKELGDRFSMLNFFVTLSNDAGVPIVFSGTNAMFKLFSRVVRNARRALGMGEFFFDRFSKKDEEWETLVAFLFRYNWSGREVIVDDQMQATVYELTQGNTDFLVKLLTLAQWQSIYDGKPITPDMLQEVYDKQMRLLHRAIDALRSQDPDQIKDFEDLMPAKDQVALMLNSDLKRRARRADLSLLHQGLPSSNLTEASSVLPVADPILPTLVSVPSADRGNDSREIVESSSWEEAMREKGWVADGKGDLW